MKHLGKKKIIIIAGVSAAVLVTALGVGLGVGLSSSTTVDEGEMYLDPISGETRSERDLLNNDITIDGKTFDVIKEGDKLFAIIPRNTNLELIQPTYHFHLAINDDLTAGDPSVDETIKNVPEDDPDKAIIQQALNNLGIISFGEDYFYTIIFAGVGHVKILNDGFIWGGFHYNQDTDQIEKHEALTNGPLKFGTVYPNGYALIDFAVVNEYQQALKNYDEAANEVDKNTAAERMRNADSRNSKENRDNVEFTWKILNMIGRARLYSNNISESIATLSINPETTGTEDYFTIDASISNYKFDGNEPNVDENGKFNVSELECGENNDIHGYWPVLLYHDDNTKVCLEPNNADENGLAVVNQEVSVKLGDLNYQLFNFQGGHIKNPLLSGISATPDGYVTLPDITDPVRVQEKTNYVVVPSDLKFELNKAPSS